MYTCICACICIYIYIYIYIYKYVYIYMYITIFTQSCLTIFFLAAMIYQASTLKIRQTTTDNLPPIAVFCSSMNDEIGIKVSDQGCVKKVKYNIGSIV